MLDDFKKIGSEAAAALGEVKDAAALEEFRIKYYSGYFTYIFNLILIS